MTNYRFSKNERLKGQKDVERLFHKGKSIYKYPLRAVYQFIPVEPHIKDGTGLKVAFSVPKRKISLAVHRNLVKRRMREAYRLNRIEKTEGMEHIFEHHQIHLILIYQHSVILDFKTIEKSVIKLLTSILSDDPENS